MNDIEKYNRIAKNAISNIKQDCVIDDEEAYQKELVDFLDYFNRKHEALNFHGLGYPPEIRALEEEKKQRIMEINQRHLTKKGG